MSDRESGASVAESGLVGASADVAQFEEESPDAVRRIQQFFHQYPTTIPFLILLLAAVAFTFVTNGRFLSPLNLSLILTQVTIIGTLATAQTLVIITAGIDLSVGAIMVLSSIVMGKLATDAGVPVPIAFGLGLLTGL